MQRMAQNQKNTSGHRNLSAESADSVEMFAQLLVAAFATFRRSAVLCYLQ